MSDYISSNEWRTYDNTRQGADRPTSKLVMVQPQNFRENANLATRIATRAVLAPQKDQNRFPARTSLGELTTLPHNLYSAGEGKYTLPISHPTRRLRRLDSLLSRLRRSFPRFASSFPPRLIWFFAEPWGARIVNDWSARAKIDWKSAFLQGVAQYPSNFHAKGDVPTNQFCTDRYRLIECHITLSLTLFTHRNFVADFLQAKCDFTWKTAVLLFEPPLRGLGAMYNVYLGSLESA